MNIITTINATLGILIMLLGLRAYRKLGSKLYLSLSIAFGIFAVTHIVTLLGIARYLMTMLLTLRVIAYGMVVLSLHKVLKSAK